MVAASDWLVGSFGRQHGSISQAGQQAKYRTTEDRIDETSVENRQGTPPGVPHTDGLKAPSTAQPAQQNDSDVKTKMYFQSLRYSYIGIFFGVAVVLGYGVGSALDRRFGTGSWLTMVGVLLGIASGFNELIRLARKYQRELSQKQESP